MKVYDFFALIFNTLAYLCCLTGPSRHKKSFHTDLESQLPRERRRHSSNATSGSTAAIAHRPRRDTMRSEKSIDANTTTAAATETAGKLSLATDSPEAIQHLDARLRELSIAQTCNHVEDVEDVEAACKAEDECAASREVLGQAGLDGNLTGATQEERREEEEGGTSGKEEHRDGIASVQETVDHDPRNDAYAKYREENAKYRDFDWTDTMLNNPIAPVFKPAGDSAKILYDFFIQDKQFDPAYMSPRLRTCLQACKDSYPGDLKALGELYLAEDLSAPLPDLHIVTVLCLGLPAVLSVIQSLYEQEFAEPFKQLVEDWVVFLVHELHPYVVQLGPSYPSAFGARGVERMYNMLTTGLLLPAGCYGFSMNDLYERWARGMLRVSQIRLVKLILTISMGRIRSLIAQGKGLFDLEGEIGYFVPMMDFVTHRRFRSERMEIMILRYLDEADFNVDVARGVEASTEEVGAKLFWRQEMKERLPELFV